MKPEDRNPRSEAEAELQKSERNCELKLDFEKSDPGNKHHVQKQLSGSDRAGKCFFSFWIFFLELLLCYFVHVINMDLSLFLKFSSSS